MLQCYNQQHLVCAQKPTFSLPGETKQKEFKEKEVTRFSGQFPG